jgi:hypothetical protein
MFRFFFLVLAALAVQVSGVAMAEAQDAPKKFGDSTSVTLKPGAKPEKYTVRLKVVNNSGADAVMWVTPPWDDKNIAEPESFFWGGLNGGQKVCKAADGGKYISDMSKCPGNANYLYKIELPAFSEKYMYLPDGGAASNQFFFHMGCTKNPNKESWNRDFDDCVIGSFFGSTPTPISNELMGSNTLFEATWGCNKNDKDVACNKNPSSASGEPLTDQDWIDISIVDGYTTPVSIKVENAKDCQYKKGDKWDGYEEGKFLDTASCPSENTSTIFAQSDNLKSYFKDKDKGKGQPANVLDLKTVEKDRRSADQKPWNPQKDKNVVNCVAPYKMLATQYLGAAEGLDGRPMQSVKYDGAKDAHKKMNEINWYGCDGRCPDKGAVVDADCPAMSPAACLKGPEGQGKFSAAKTNFVTRLKAMGMKAYTWQFDDDYGSKHCTYGGNYTITLAPGSIEGQIPWDNVVVDKKDRTKATPYLWVYEPGSNSCIVSTSATKDQGGADNYYDCIANKAKYKAITDHDTLKYCVPAEAKDGKGVTLYDGYCACAATLGPTKPECCANL